MAEEFSLETASQDEINAFAAVRKAFKVPGAKKLIQKALKEANPDLDIPELELDSRIEKEVGGIRKEFQDYKEGVAKEKLTSKLEAERKALRDAGFSAEDVTAIEKKMADEGIVNHATAGKLFKLERQAAMPTPQVSWKAKKEEKFVIDKEVMQDPAALKNWSTNEAAAAIDEIRAAR